MATTGLGSVARSVSITATGSSTFFGKPRLVEPLNVDSLLDKIKATCCDKSPSDQVRIFRNDYSRLLFFHEADLISAKAKMTAASSSSSSQKPSRGNYYHKRSIFSPALPFAVLQPPPLLNFPRVQLPLWRTAGDVDFWALTVPTAPTLSTYMNLLEDDDAQKENAVGILCASHNQLNFVISNRKREQLFGPVSSMRLGGNDGAERDSFYAAFWKKLAGELKTSNGLLERCSVLWFKSEGHVGEELYASCCSSICDDDQVKKFQVDLREDERWTRLHSLNFSSKAKHDTDCMLRDLGYGELRVFS